MTPVFLPRRGCKDAAYAPHVLRDECFAHSDFELVTSGSPATAPAA